MREHRELLKLLKRTDTELGGGTVLAMHWNNHRRSTDLDFMMRAEASTNISKRSRQCYGISLPKSTRSLTTKKREHQSCLPHKT